MPCDRDFQINQTEKNAPSAKKRRAGCCWHLIGTRGKGGEASHALIVGGVQWMGGPNRF